MLKIVFHGENDPSWNGVTEAVAKQLREEGHEVLVINVSDFSYPNLKPLSTKLQALFARTDLARFMAPHSQVWEESIKHTTSIDLLNQIQVDDEIKIRAAIKSLAMSVFGDYRPERHLLLFPLIARQQLKFSRELFSLVVERTKSLGKISELVIPNGRFPYQMTLQLAARKLGVPVLFFERGFSSGWKYYLGGLSPHDRVGWQLGSRKAIWREPALVRCKTMNWLESRKNPSAAENVFNRNWESYHLVDDGKRHPTVHDSTVFFTSSQDEFLSMEGWEGFGWRDQYEAFAAFAGQVSGEKVLRIHPNFLNKAFGNSLDELRRIFWFRSKVKGAQIIWPDESRNSYELLDNCSRVVVYGSTIGLEASCSGKSVWTAGNSLYDLEADIRIFRPKTLFDAKFFEPWVVNSEPALRVADFLINNDRDLVVTGPTWESDSVPFLVRAIKFLSNGLNSYLVVVAKSLISRALVSALVICARTVTYLEIKAFPRLRPKSSSPSP